MKLFKHGRLRISMVLALMAAPVATTHGDIEPTTDGDFALAGAERIIITNQVVLEQLIEDDGKSLSDVVFTDDGSRFVYALHHNETRSQTNDTPAMNEIIVRDTATFGTLATFRWDAPEGINSIAWSPRSERILCISGGSRAIAVVDMQKKKVTGAPIEGGMLYYVTRSKWQTDTDVILFCEGGSGQWVQTLDLDTLKLKDGTHDRDEFDKIQRSTFAHPSDHKMAIAVTQAKGRYQTDAFVAMQNRDGSFFRPLPEANQVSVQTISGCYAAPDLRTIVMAQRLIHNGSAGATNLWLTGFRMGLRPPPVLNFSIAFNTGKDVSTDNRDDFRKMRDADCPLWGEIYAPFVNPLTGRVVGPDVDHKKGEVHTLSIGASASIVRVIVENEPIEAGDVMANVRSERMLKNINESSGGGCFYLDKDKWFILEPIKTGALNESSSTDGSSNSDVPGPGRGSANATGEDILRDLCDRVENNNLFRAANINDIHKPYDVVWVAVQETLQQREENVLKADKATGVIETDITRHGMLGFPAYDKFIIVVEKVGETNTNVHFKRFGYTLDQGRTIVPQRNQDINKRRNDQFFENFIKNLRNNTT